MGEFEWEAAFRSFSSFPTSYDPPQILFLRNVARLPAGTLAASRCDFVHTGSRSSMHGQLQPCWNLQNNLRRARQGITQLPGCEPPSRQQHAEEPVVVVYQTNRDRKTHEEKFRSDKHKGQKFSVSEPSEIQVSATAYSWCSGMTGNCPAESFNVKVLGTQKRICWYGIVPYV